MEKGSISKIKPNNWKQMNVKTIIKVKCSRMVILMKFNNRTKKHLKEMNQVMIKKPLSRMNQENLLKFFKHAIN